MLERTGSTAVDMVLVMDIGQFVEFAGVFASFLALGAMVTHMLLSKDILPSGPFLAAAEWVLAVASVVLAIVTIFGHMGGQVPFAVSGIVLNIVFTVFAMIALVLGAIWLDARRKKAVLGSNHPSEGT